MGIVLDPIYILGEPIILGYKPIEFSLENNFSSHSQKNIFELF